MQPIRNWIPKGNVTQLMGRMTLFMLVASTLVIFSLVLVAQENAADPVFRGGITQVVAPTTVLDKDGNYVPGLTPSVFRLYDNGKIQDIHVDETLTPVSLVVVVQSNAKAESAIPKVQKLATMFQTLVAGDHGEVAILAFDHRIRNLQDFTSDPIELEEALKKLSPGSSSSRMVDSVMEAAQMLEKRPKNRRKVILLISETRDGKSEGRVRDALTAMEMANVTLYSVNMSRFANELTSKPPIPRPDPIPATARHVPGGGVQTPTSVAQMTGTQGYGANFAPLIAEIYQSVRAVFVENPVEIFTKYTGGEERGFVSQRDLERAVADIGREIHNQYLITYTPNNREEGGFHNIRVEIHKPDLEVRTRPGYWMAAVAR